MTDRLEQVSGRPDMAPSWRRWTAALMGGAMVTGAPALAEAPGQASLQPVTFTLHDSGADRSVPRNVRTLDMQPVLGKVARPALTAETAVRARFGSFRPNTHLQVCFRRLSNAPALDSARYVRSYVPLVLARGRVALAAAPVNNACMSSGFGPRAGRTHEGIDLSGHRGDPVFAAGPGIVREAGWGRGYGRYVVIDHGHGVFTRYAHLETIAKTVKPGTALGFGETLGRMGNSGNSTGVHLHYEVLTGKWGPSRAYGLTPHNPLDLPAYTPSRADAILTIDADLTNTVPN